MNLFFSHKLLVNLRYISNEQFYLMVSLCNGDSLLRYDYLAHIGYLLRNKNFLEATFLNSIRISV